MLNVFYLIAIIIGLSGQSIVKKTYTKKVGDGGIYFFNTVLSAAALLFFVVTSSKLDFDTSLYHIQLGLLYLML